MRSRQIPAIAWPPLLFIVHLLLLGKYSLTQYPRPSFDRLHSCFSLNASTPLNFKILSVFLGSLYLRVELCLVMFLLLDLRQLLPIKLALLFFWMSDGRSAFAGRHCSLHHCHWILAFNTDAAFNVLQTLATVRSFILEINDVWQLKRVLVEFVAVGHSSFVVYLVHFAIDLNLLCNHFVR